MMLTDNNISRMLTGWKNPLYKISSAGGFGDLLCIKTTDRWSSNNILHGGGGASFIEPSSKSFKEISCTELYRWQESWVCLLFVPRASKHSITILEPTDTFFIKLCFWNNSIKHGTAVQASFAFKIPQLGCEFPCPFLLRLVFLHTQNMFSDAHYYARCSIIWKGGIQLISEI